MLLEKIKSDGLAQLSYILGDGDEAIVIDPRRDCDVYLDIAAHEGMCITHIFETHRNEDFAIGSLDLARLSGAVIHHGSHGLKVLRTSCWGICRGIWMKSTRTSRS